MNVLKYILLMLVASVIVLVSSCKKDDIITDPVIFYDDRTTVLQYRCINDDIEFFVDALSDTTNHIGGEYPNVDFCGISIDYNNNGVLDANIDLQVSQLADERMCVSYLLSQNSSTPCEFYSDVTGETKFSSTINSTEPHMNYTIRIPKSRISENNVSNLSIRLHNAETGFEFIPREQDYFTSTIEIEW